MDIKSLSTDHQYLNNLLSSQSYINGHTLSESDQTTFREINVTNLNIIQFPNVMRWYNHIKFLMNDASIAISVAKTSKPFSTMNKLSSSHTSPIKKTQSDHSNKKMGKGIKEGVKGEGADDVNKGVKGELAQQPCFIQERLQLWDKLKHESDAALAAKTAEPIKITLPDGNVKDGLSWRTTPLEIAEGISKGLAENSVVAKVNNEVWDLERPFEGDSSLELLNFKDGDAKTVFWHSSAHIFGECMERVYGGHLCYGPPIEEGFYYDMHMENGSVSMNDYPVIEDVCKKIVKEKQPFERLEMTKENLLQMFKYNKFKQRIINERVKTDTTTVYRCGTLIDLCRGPHVRHTGKVKALAVTKNSCALWEGKKEAESLQRVYGMSFPDPKQLKEWKHFQEEAAKRDHRKIGIAQKLFFFHEVSPGSCFFLPKGTYIYNKLIEYMRDQYHMWDFQEVVTPNIYKTKLWKTSGHWDHYEQNMFSFECEKDHFALKPMNCPGHCIMFRHTQRSWRELPLRLADFGVLHRNEYSGGLTGLTRVRRFQQDDAHIFCASESIKDEIRGALEFLSEVYATLGFEFQLKLATRPDKHMGDTALWDRAENQLKESLQEFGKTWELNAGDGAFYGPKIDITVTDALRRHHQCATIQLDFQLPIRFDLTYVNDLGELVRPVIIHRAILGSVERMMAILTESYGGKWPLWLSPRQVQIIPVIPMFNDYANSIRRTLKRARIEVDVNSDPGLTLNKKIREAQLDQYNFILVVGEKEQSNKTVNVRTRDNKVRGEMSLDEMIKRLKELMESRTLNSEDEF